MKFKDKIMLYCFRHQGSETLAGFLSRNEILDI